ncbi:alpha-crystallin domain-containing protein 22.3 isoform X2 [Durio zibethinus]|nr:alpha-crystallin domain-containing protein 22.3 isoform X2 [Durio zibethinus]XP_022719349.1 alpha-crystallin domain-containing protein 22.3 isoform X2 [Durio zibethinus]
MNPQQPVLDVAPLNCVPYVGPTNPDDTVSSPTNEKIEAAETIGPAMILLPSQSTREELDSIMATIKNGVVLTGAAATGTVGPILGKVDIGELEDSYYFRVALPGVSMDKRDFNCDIEPDGKVLIKGISTTGEKIVCKNFQIFHMLTQNLCPPGHFTVSFQLPGPVNNYEVTSLLADGIFEAIVKKM